MENVTQIPVESLIAEKLSQRERILQEVMEGLFAKLPPRATKQDGGPDFVLSNGQKCWIKAFSAPRDRGEGLQYGFDVRLEPGYPLDHLEFFVRCTGHGGAVI